VRSIFITSNRRLLRQVGRQVARHGFTASPYASAWTSLHIRRADEHVGITCLDSRDEVITDWRGLVERIESTSHDVFRQIGIRTVFVVTFSLSDAERQGAARAIICLLHVGQLAETFDILDTHRIANNVATADQSRLAGQIAGTCRRFSRACQAAGDLDGAIAWRLQQSTISRPSFEVCCAQGYLYAKRGDLGEAEICLNQALKIGGANLPIQLLLAEVKQRQGDLIVAGEVAGLAATRKETELGRSPD